MHTEEDGGLFADPRPTPIETPAQDPDALPGWLVANLRKALDDLGVESPADRQALIVELAGRQVESLRGLTYLEARSVSEKLTARRHRKGAATARSAWDDRDDETWIDRL